MKNNLRRFREYLPLSARGWTVLGIALSAAALLCALLSRTTTSDTHVPLIFVLAVLVVSLFTEGYFYGLLAAVISVIGVNYAFTYPYLKFDFTIYGYPLTFLTMLAVGFAVSTLTTRLKEQEKLRADSEREKMRSNLLRTISHDLRTPLTAISGAISTVLENGDQLTARQTADLLSDARQDAEWLTRMVENLLSITRMGGSEAAELRKEDEILEEILGEAVMKFRKHHAGVDVNVSVPEEPLLLPMDAMLIEQVLTNLMENAVIHGKGTTRLDVRARCDGAFAYISVADNGGGIPAALLPRLFDGSLPLGSAGTADRRRNMGIGLTLCRTIVEAHGGRISAENADEGAAFTFTLPMEEGGRT